MRCQRCQGLMVNDYLLDLVNVSGEMDFPGWRCLNCGDITDPVIVRHHQLDVRAPAKSKRRWWGKPIFGRALAFSASDAPDQSTSLQGGLTAKAALMRPTWE
jgi:hypothetical protein